MITSAQTSAGVNCSKMRFGVRALGAVGSDSEIGCILEIDGRTADNYELRRSDFSEASHIAVLEPLPMKGFRTNGIM
jgi:hypothetical protein